MTQNATLASAALVIAKTHLGEKEKTGHNDGPFVNMLQTWFGGKGELGDPWCALFRSWCIYQAALQLKMTPVVPKSDSSTFLYGFAKQHLLLLPEPIPGCTGLLKGDGGTAGKSHHHTFGAMTPDLKLGVVHGIDGNWGNQVAYTSHRIQDCDFMMVV